MAKRRGRPPVVVQEVVVQQVAALAVTGATRNAICKTLGVTPQFLARTYQSDEFKKQVKLIGDDAVESSKNVIRTRVANLSDKIMTALEEGLENGSVEAIKVALKVIGFGEEEKVQGDTQIQVILPGQAQEKSIDVEVQNKKS